MNPVTGPYAGVEAAYRRERISADFTKGSRHHHPVRSAARAISKLHHRLEVI
jgi:hypothetical protein